MSVRPRLVPARVVAGDVSSMPGRVWRWGELVTDPATGSLRVGDGVRPWSQLPSGQGGGSLAETFETVAKNLDAADATLTYSGGELASIVYASGVTKTFGYSGGRLVSVTLSGATPDGIALTKTLSYTGDDLTGVTYS